MQGDKSLQGWVPELGETLTLAQVIDLAYDYRGNTTIVKTDGTEIVGYVFNRNNNVPEPYIQWFDEAGNGPFTILYGQVQNIKFTGKDTAAGKSWEAWVRRRDREKEKVIKRTAGLDSGETNDPMASSSGDAADLR